MLARAARRRYFGPLGCFHRTAHGDLAAAAAAAPPRLGLHSARASRTEFRKPLVLCSLPWSSSEDVASPEAQVGRLKYPFSTRRGPLLEGPILYTIPLWGSKGPMSHISREKLDLLNRTKKIVGQLESAQRALNKDEPCSDILQRLAAARGAINSLMGELLEDHIRNHLPQRSKSAAEAAEDVIEIVRTYLK
jgi:DNA-binding FrmR family transcriptional regulator